MNKRQDEIQDESFGIIPLRIRNKEWEVLIVEHLKGHWSFPKGHLDGNESAQIAAERELMEETNLEVEEYLFDEILKERYIYFEKNKQVNKQVHYFVAKVKGEARPQLDEIKTCRWYSLNDAASYLTYKNTRQIVVQLTQLLERI